jgi:hypothetical protein
MIEERRERRLDLVLWGEVPFPGSHFPGPLHRRGSWRWRSKHGICELQLIHALQGILDIALAAEKIRPRGRGIFGPMLSCRGLVMRLTLKGSEFAAKLVIFLLELFHSFVRARIFKYWR